MPETLEELDSAVRMAAFAFLEDRLSGTAEETLAFDVLRVGFAFRGRRVPLLGPQGIFKPAVLPEMPLSIMTTAPKPGKPVPYDDSVDSAGVLSYSYRKGEPIHPDNVGLQKVMYRRAPLVYLRGIVPGRYLPFFPVYVEAEDRARRLFQIPLEHREALRNTESVDDEETAEPRRAYVSRPVKVRLHQTSFRERVLGAYRECCAICRLRHRELLDATHILPDKHPLGEPVVSNGLSLCKLHHAAYDKHIIGIGPDLNIHVRVDILEEIDGPMLQHGLQGFQGQRITTPRNAKDYPNPDFLAHRFELFQRAS